MQLSAWTLQGRIRPPTCNREKVTTYVSPFGPSAENDQMQRLSDPRRFTHMPRSGKHRQLLMWATEESVNTTAARLRLRSRFSVILARWCHLRMVP